jgi:hypothetical protein
LLTFDAVDPDFGPGPAHNVNCDKLKLRRGSLLEFNDIDSARTLLADMPSLRVARVDDGGICRPEQLAFVYVAESPVVHPAAFEIGKTAGGVGVVALLRSHRCVQDRHVHRRCGRGCESARQVLAHDAPGEAGAVNRDPLRARRVERYRLRFRPKAIAALGHGEGRLPAIEWIVVTVRDERTDAVVGESLEPGLERQLRAQAAVRSIVDIAGDEEGIDMAIDAQVDDALERIEGRCARKLPDAVVDAPQPPEWAIEMEVGGVHKAEWFHEKNSIIRISM